MQNKNEYLNLSNRIYVERVRAFFGSATGNTSSAIVGALFIAIVLKLAGVMLIDIVIWMSFIVLFSLITVYVEKRITQERLTIENASKWYYLRIAPSSMISLLYGLAPFLFGNYLSIVEEMFIFIILSAMVSVAIVGYPTMPYYYILLNGVTMLPLSISFLLHFDTMHYILAITSIVWQYLVLSKGWKVSKGAIESIRLNEELQNEIKHHKRTKEKLHELATHDALTGLPNRRLLMKNLDSMLSLAQRYEKKIILMFIDVDGFKNVNDTYGHEAGDYVLQELSKRFSLHIRESDTLARLGGDEFILGFLELDSMKLDTTVLANRVLDSINQEIILPNTEVADIGLSIGIAEFPNDGNSSESLIRVADANMYISKAKGGMQFTSYRDT